MQSRAGCGYCGPVKPVFADVAARLQGGHPIVVAAVDCSDDDELAMTCNVNALPAMLFYQNGGQAGQAVEYQGDWSADNIRLFAVNNSAAAHKCTKVRKTCDGVARKKPKGRGQTGKKYKIKRKKRKKKTVS